LWPTKQPITFPFVGAYGKRARRRYHRQIVLRNPTVRNIRELANVIERAVILTDGDVLRISAGIFGHDLPVAAAGSASNEAGNQISAQERQLIEKALAESNGRVAGPRGAASRLGLCASTLESKIRRLGVDKYWFFQRAPKKKR
jgi:formate hydrogenlyase transcriptional activator